MKSQKNEENVAETEITFAGSELDPSIDHLKCSPDQDEGPIVKPFCMKMRIEKVIARGEFRNPQKWAPGLIKRI